MSELLIIEDLFLLLHDDGSAVSQTVAATQAAVTVAITVPVIVTSTN